MRVCMTYAFLGVLSVTMTADAKLAPPMVADLVPGHNQTKEFDKNVGTFCKPPRYVPYKCTYVPYNGTFGASEQGQMLDVWG